VTSEFRPQPKPLPRNVDEERFFAEVEDGLRRATPRRYLRDLIYRWFREEHLDEGEALGILTRFMQRELMGDERDNDYTIVTDVMDLLDGWGAGTAAIRRPPATK
jgi:hypothetical protein